jgi:phage head maturation protease
MKRLYAEIAKTEAQDDGTIKVYGYASSGAEDSDGETITAGAMKAALPDYMKFGAVREMHDSKKAAGTAIEAEVQEDGRTWFGAHVVDPIAVKKVEAGVYKGFSIGGKVVARDELNKRLINGIKLVEVSLVDRPANPDAVFTMFKAESVDGQPGDEGEATEKNNDPGAGEDLNKGMYNVSRFAEMLESISYMVSSAQNEADYEGDNSPIPAQLRDWLKQGAVIFTGMAVEEVNELVAQVNTMKAASVDGLAKARGFTISDGKGETFWAAPQGADGESIGKAANGSLPMGDAERVKFLTDSGYTATTVTKAGARYSKTTKAMLKAAHDACKAADKALADLKYDEAEDDEQAKAEAVSDGAHDALLKACGAAGCPEGAVAADWIAEIATELESMRELSKAAGIEGETPSALVNALAKRVKEQADEIAKLKDQPAPPKGYANGVALTKSDDRAGGDAKEVAPVITSSGEENEVATLIKAAQAKPIRLA